jgi:hypothetical protein
LGSGTLTLPAGTLAKPSINWGGVIGIYSDNYSINIGSTSASFLTLADSYNRSSFPFRLDAQKITAGSGTGLTVVSPGHIAQEVYSVTVTYAAFSSAGSLTADKTIATLPAKTKIVAMYADTTTPFAGTGVTDVDLSVGKSAGGVEYIALHNVFSGAVTKGLADADMGTELVSAARIQGGAIVNWASTTTVSARITTTTTHTDDLTAGSVTFYIVTERY